MCRYSQRFYSHTLTQSREPVKQRIKGLPGVDALDSQLGTQLGSPFGTPTQLNSCFTAC